MWKTVKLGDVLERIQNGINCKQDKSGTGQKITRIETIADTKINYHKTGYAILNETEKQKARLEVGDILFSHINSPVHVGKTAIYNGEEPIWHGINLLRIKTVDEVNARYFNYFLNFLFCNGYWKRTAKQSVNQASVNQNDIKIVPFSYPPLAEQERIVAKLDKAFAEIDKAIALAEAKKIQAKNMRQALLQSSLNDDAVMWKQTTLGMSCKMYQPRTISATDMVADGNYVVFGANGIIGKYTDYNHADSQLLVTCRGATCGSVNVSEPFSWINGNAMVIQPDLSEITLKYMEYLFRGGIDLSKTITGAAQPQITRKSLEPIEFSYPPLAEQERITAKLDKVFAEIDSINTATSKIIENYNALKSSLLSQILQGKAA